LAWAWDRSASTRRNGAIVDDEKAAGMFAEPIEHRPEADRLLGGVPFGQVQGLRAGQRREAAPQRFGRWSRSACPEGCYQSPTGIADVPRRLPQAAHLAGPKDAKLILPGLALA